MASTHLSTNPPESPVTDGADSREYDAESLLELLGDEYTQQVLAALGDNSLTGSELIDCTGVSKATAYRRLDDLQDAGIVESALHIDPGGHHCEQYRLAVDELAISFGPDGFDVTIDNPETDSPADKESLSIAPADD
ncbi:ArsR/SmtB family transcription factor [Halovenus rubra]|uniref:ArsR/SmtB family transcription factor n=2 Tax=Halovenus rubra TaxID=869890 RepID=A0ACC7E4E2_9EURY|nr:winged helix-turn-helix domain-containing protein [Halovenus rubra]